MYTAAVGERERSIQLASAVVYSYVHIVWLKHVLPRSSSSSSIACLMCVSQSVSLSVCLSVCPSVCLSVPTVSKVEEEEEEDEASF